MNQRFDPTENRNVNPAAWPAEDATRRADPATDPLLNQRRPEDVAPRARSNWPILIILLAGLVLALLVWLPSEMSSDQATAPAPAPTDTATPPADSATPPADTAIPPAAMTPAPTPDTSATPPAAPDTQTPATGTETPPAATDTQPPATGTAPQN